MMDTELKFRGYQYMHHRSPRRKNEGKIPGKKIFERLTDRNFPNVMKNIVHSLQIQEVQQIPSRINMKKSISRKIVPKPVHSQRQGDWLLVYRERENKTKGWLIIRNIKSQDTIEWQTQSNKSKNKKQNCQLKFCILQKYPSKMKTK